MSQHGVLFVLFALWSPTVYHKEQKDGGNVDVGLKHGSIIWIKTANSHIRRTAS